MIIINDDQTIISTHKKMVIILPWMFSGNMYWVRLIWVEITLLFENILLQRIFRISGLSKTYLHLFIIPPGMHVKWVSSEQFLGNKLLFLSFLFSKSACNEFLQLVLYTTWRT